MRFFLILFIIPTIAFGQWTQIGSDINGEAFNDEFGYSISLNGDGSIVAVGAYLNDGNGVDSGQVRVYENLAGVWTQIGLDIDGEAAGDESGNSISLSDDGAVVAIGAYENDGNGTSSGHVRVYQNVLGTWTQIGSDIDGEALNDNFGRSVSLSGDGAIVAIGADNNNNGTGHVRIFQNVGNVWTQVGSDIDGVAIEDRIGDSVGLNNDGTIVAIGATGNDFGRVEVYENIANAWTKVGSNINGNSIDDEFGGSVSLSANGDIVAIGAPSDTVNGEFSGYVKVFKNVLGTWTQIGSDIDGQAADEFSNEVSLSDNGTILAIGGPGDFFTTTDTGRVRIYQNVSDVWTQIGSDINGGTIGDSFGSSVSLSGDGSILAIGASGNDGIVTDPGYAGVYNNNALSLIDNTFGESFELFPNPSFEVVNVNLGDYYTDISVKVFDVSGKLIMDKMYRNTDRIKLRTQNYKSGIYFVNIGSNDNNVTFKMVVK